MNIEELVEGRVFKNYRDLCTTLGVKAKAGNGKKYQLRDIGRYCVVTKGNGFLLHISEVFDIPLPPLQKKGERTQQSILIELLLTDFLIARWQDSGNPTLIMTRNSLMSNLDMINTNFIHCSYNTHKLSKHTEINEDVIKDFFTTAFDNFRYSIGSALSILEDKSLIMYDKIRMVCPVEGNHYEANDHQRLEILRIEKEVLDNLGLDSFNQARVSRHWETFKRLSGNLLRERMDIAYHYVSYKISLNDVHIESNHMKLLLMMMDTETRSSEKSLLNKVICERLLENANNRKYNTKETSYMYPVRVSDTYIPNTETLTKLLVDKSTEDFTTNMNKNKI